MCSIPTIAKAKKPQSTSWAPINNVPSPGARLLIAAAARAGAKCPMNMSQLASLSVAQVAMALAVAVAKAPQKMSSTLTCVAQTLNTAWLVRSKVA